MEHVSPGLAVLLYAVLSFCGLALFLMRKFPESRVVRWLGVLAIILFYLAFCGVRL